MMGVAKLASGPGHVGLVDRPVRDPARGEVLVEVHGAGVCGTDLHIEAGEYRTSPPVTMGHEVAGVVAAVGPDVDDRWVGVRVACETYYEVCGDCALCRGGRPNLCGARISIGSGADGGFASRLVTPARNLHALPDWLDSHAAALAEPLACVCNCLFSGPTVSIGDEVLVTGPGPVGLLAAQVARAMGGSVTVAGLPSDEPRLAAAERLGFGVVVGPAALAVESADVVIECSGTAGGATACMEAARRGGRYIQVGVFGKPVAAPFDRVFEKELVISSGFASTPQSWQRAMRLIEQKAVQLEPLVSRVAPLASWADVFAELRAGQGLKIVFDPRLDTSG